MKFDNYMPTDCKLVLDMIMIIFRKEPNLEQEKLMLKDPELFLQQIMDYDMSNADTLMQDQVKEKLSQGLQLQRLNKISFACSALMDWIKDWMAMSKLQIQKTKLEMEMDLLNKKPLALDPKLLEQIIAQQVREQTAIQIQQEITFQSYMLTVELENQFEETIDILAEHNIDLAMMKQLYVKRASTSLGPNVESRLSSFGMYKEEKQRWKC